MAANGKAEIKNLHGQVERKKKYRNVVLKKANWKRASRVLI